jgi:hypothetical protein
MLSMISKITLEMLIVGLLVFAFSPLLAQQTQVQPLPNGPPHLVNPPSEIKPPTEVEQIRSLQHDVQDLKTRLGTAEQNLGTIQSQLSKLLAKASFSCKTKTISVNGAGVEQNCFPYLCHPIDGRCAPQTCSSVNDCASPTACDDSNHCDYPRQR